MLGMDRDYAERNRTFVTLMIDVAIERAAVPNDELACACHSYRSFSASVGELNGASLYRRAAVRAIRRFQRSSRRTRSNLARAVSILPIFLSAQALRPMTGSSSERPSARQLVVDARRNGRKHRAGDQAVALQAAQSQSQHALRNAADLALEFIEAHGTRAQAADDQNRPFVADAREHAADRAAVAGVMDVTLFHLRAFLRDVLAGIILASVTIGNLAPNRYLFKETPMALKLHTVITSTRPGRAGPVIAHWFHEGAQGARQIRR